MHRALFSAGLLALFPLALAACASAPCPAPALALAPTPASAPAPALTSSPDADADLVLLVRPSSSPRLVHVEVALPRTRTGSTPTAWTLLDGVPDHVAHAVAHDSGGDIPVRTTAAGHGVELVLDRANVGPVSLAYDVLPGDDAPDDPRGILLADDRFRGPGEKLVALPSGADDLPCNAVVHVEGEALRASGAASSAGVGASRRITLRAGGLRTMTFVAGSIGVQVSDDPSAGHDEGAWLGYTAFDPRPTIAEMALVRSTLRELLGSPGEPGAWTYLLVSQARALGSFSTTPRTRSILLQVGPGEPWSAGLRLSVAQQLARRWIGGELAVEGDGAGAGGAGGSGGEGAWFAEGVSRYVAMALLVRLGFITPDEMRDVVDGELSVLATSPVRAQDDVHLAAIASQDVARATLMARGALYALRESFALRKASKGQKGLVPVLAELLRRAEEKKSRALTPAAWIAALAADPDAQKTFDALVVRGEPVVLPPDALGPCFRASMGEYVAFDPGFALDATRASPDAKVSGVVPGGPAAKAGLKDGDVIESLHARDGDGTAPMKLVVTRADRKIALSYLPAGARGRGQTWTRVKLPDDRCGEVP
ncbi:MAG TPA: hypothetical protein VGG39_19640 [Polyangiaceae bacterium]